MIQDLKRFALWARPILDIAPLQLYSSALLFAPEKSITREKFNNYVPKSFHLRSRIRDDWSALLQTLEGHSGWVSSIAFSPDGTQLASGSDDRTIKLWDAATGSLQRTLEGHSSPVNSVAFSPDGTQLASGSDDRTIKLWDAATGSLQRTLESHSGPVGSIAFSPDGRIYQIDEINILLSHLKRVSTISVREHWITRDIERILWLPFEYRASCSDVKDHRIVVGHSSGQITILEFVMG